MHQKHVLIATSTSSVADTVSMGLVGLELRKIFCSIESVFYELSRETYDLLIVDFSNRSVFSQSSPLGTTVSEALAVLEEKLAASDCTALLVMLPLSEVADIRLPVKILSDFITTESMKHEAAPRIRNLLWPGEESTQNALVSDGQLMLNLATYQVFVGTKPLNLTYQEYELLAFLVTHPGKTYSRQMLLQRVWGFDYFGGSRTVDVHVRRLRAKLGPETSRKLETVRGYGYLWSAN